MLAARVLTADPSADDYWPCFSPDGKTILFSRSLDGRKTWELYAVPAEGGDARRFLRTPVPVSATRANWSWRAGAIAFTGTSADGASGVWIADGAGVKAERVLLNGVSDGLLYPAWYPDARRLAVLDSEAQAIVRIDRAGGAAVRLTDPRTVYTGMPRVSPDGRWIAFAGQKNTGVPYDQTKNAIWLLGDGGELRSLEAVPAQARTPAWSPDGRRIAFQSNRGRADGFHAIFVANRDGTGLLRVTGYERDANHPEWSPDGKQLAFTVRHSAESRATGIAITDAPSAEVVVEPASGRPSSIPVAAKDAVPAGWRLVSPAADAFSARVDREQKRSGGGSALLECTTEDVDTFGTLMQTFRADDYRGRRVRLSGWLRSRGLERWAGLWMRVIGQTESPLAFDNMSKRPVRGDTEWTRQEVVLDVPNAAALVSYGAILGGRGRLWVDDLSIEVVPDSVPTTDMGEPPAPTKTVVRPDHAPKPINTGFEDAETSPAAVAPVLEVETASDHPEERAIAERVRRVIEKKRLDPWLFTPTIRIDRTAPIPHSHPVLTLNTDFRTDDEVLSSLIHEQFHWFVLRDQKALGAAVRDLKARYPDAPAGPPQGARDLNSTYLHLLVCSLEYEGLERTIGRRKAERLLLRMGHYTWIYRTVVKDRGALRAVLARHGFALP